MTEVKSERRTIGVEEAKLLLTRNINNRKLRKAGDTGWEWLAEQMKRGDWVFNGDSVCIDVDGNLLDGQKRMMAVVDTGIPLDTIVVSGLPPRAQDTMDIGQKRTVANQVEMRHLPNALHLASAASLCFSYFEGRMNHRDATKRRAKRPEVLEFIDKNTDELIQATRKGHMFRHYVPAATSTSGAAFFIINRVDEAVAEHFWTLLCTGEGMTGDPTLVLRNRLIRERSERRKLGGYEILPLYLKAWNAYRQDRPLQILTWKRGEPYPVAT